MATRDSRSDNDAQRMRSPLTQGAILLGVFVGMYLAVAGVVMMVPMLDAAAATALTSVAGDDRATERDSSGIGSAHAARATNKAADYDCGCD